MDKKRLNDLIEIMGVWIGGLVFGVAAIMFGIWFLMWLFGVLF